MYVIRIKDGSRYRDLERREFAADIDALDWFNDYPMQRHPILLLASPRRIVAKRRKND